MARARALAGPFAGTALPSLSCDRINYLVGEVPFYEIKNAPADTQVQWIITRDGQPPVFYEDPAHRTDGAGQWSGRGGTWTHELTGFYTITAQVEEWSARTCLTVIDAFEACGLAVDRFQQVSAVRSRTAGHYRRGATAECDSLRSSIRTEGG